MKTYDHGQRSKRSNLIGGALSWLVGQRNQLPELGDLRQIYAAAQAGNEMAMKKGPGKVYNRLKIKE
jgi:hypothetical protein